MADESGADELAKWASTYLAHAGGPNERTWLGDVTVTTAKSPTRSGPLPSVRAISLFVYGGGRAGAVMPSAPFDQFQRLDRSIMREDDVEAARDFWDRLSAEWDRCVDGVEDELAKPRRTRSSPS